MNSYHFSCGNSTDGPIGFCARVSANSPERALAILHASAPESVSVEVEGVEYFEVYISTENMSIKDIDEVDDGIGEGD